MRSDHVTTNLKLSNEGIRAAGVRVGARTAHMDFLTPLLLWRGPK